MWKNKPTIDQLQKDVAELKKELRLFREQLVHPHQQLTRNDVTHRKLVGWKRSYDKDKNKLVTKPYYIKLPEVK